LAQNTTLLICKSLAEHCDVTNPPSSSYFQSNQKYNKLKQKFISKARTAACICYHLAVFRLNYKTERDVHIYIGFKISELKSLLSKITLTPPPYF
jgi:hypothetical protein